MTLPPGCPRLATRRLATGSPTLANTIGMTDVACFVARTCGVPEVTMTSTLSRTNSAAIWTKRSARPSDQRYSIVMVRPSLQPSSRSRCVKAATNSLSAERVLWPENPMVRSFADCCARAASGQATAAPPSSVMKCLHLTPSMGSPPGTRCASLPQAQDAPVANLPRMRGCSDVRGEPRPRTPLEQLEMPGL